jgi:hypothetical protein
MSAPVESLVRELQEVGCPVGDLWELVNAKRRYPATVPVLLRWLEGLDATEIRRRPRDVEAVVRALAVPAARGKAAPLLIELFRTVPDRTGMGIRWAIGNTLEVVADDSVADEMIALAKDRRYGRAREMVVLALGRLKSERVDQVLIDLLEDEDVDGHAVVALGDRRAASAVPAISAMLQHPNSWVQKEAMKALAKIQVD